MDNVILAPAAGAPDKITPPTPRRALRRRCTSPPKPRTHEHKSDGRPDEADQGVTDVAQAQYPWEVDVVVVDEVVVLVVFVFAAVVVCVVVTGGVRSVVVDRVVVVVVTGATGVTGALVVVTGAGVLAGAAAVVVVEAWSTDGFLRWCFLWCAARLGGVAATDDVVLDVVEEVELVEAVDEDDALVPPELPQPAMTTPAISVSSAGFIHSPPVVPRLGLKANSG
jgi:hypothetical protein